MPGSKTYRRNRRSISKDNGRFQLFTSARPIVNSTGRIIGAVEIMKDMKEIKALVKEVSPPGHLSFDAFVGDTPSVRQIISYARKIGPAPSIVSIRGKRGTCKELFARAIHAESGRSGA